MALKHRQNPNQRQRIVVFVASPLAADHAQEGAVPDALVALLKKNQVAVNFVSMGTESIGKNQPLLENIVARLNASDAPLPAEHASSVVQVAPGQCLWDTVRQHASITGASSTPASRSAGGDYDAMDVNESIDPELALALRLSLEEEQQRLARLHQPPASGPSGDAVPTDNGEEEMDEETRQALAMSLQDYSNDSRSLHPSDASREP